MQRILTAVVLCLLLIPVRTCWGIGLPPNTQIHIVATADYTNVYDEPQSADPASVTLTVLQVVGAKIDWEPPHETIAQGGQTYVPLTISNIGNGPDTFRLTAISSHGWQVAFVSDENADGIHQDGERWEITDTTQLINDIGYCKCFLRVSVPADATTDDAISVTATSCYAPPQGANETVTIASPGMLSTRLALSASPASPIVGQPVTIQGLISPVIREAIGVTITPPSGSPTTTSCIPDTNGTYTATFTPTQPGDYGILASYSGNETHVPATASLTATVADKIATAITMQVVPLNPTAGGEVSISGTLSPAIATTLSMTYQPPSGSSSQATVTTDQFGRFSCSKAVDVAGAWTISAAYAGDASHSSSSSQAPVQVEAQRAEHSVSFGTAPSVNPAMVTYPEPTQCSTAASDTAGHNLEYVWSDGGVGGTFTPSPHAVSPVYLAPDNHGTANTTVTLTCTATCTADSTIAAVASATLTVRPTDSNAPSVLSVTPQVASSLVELGEDIMIRFSEAMKAAETQQAISFSPAISGISYSWDADASILTVHHQALATNTRYTCTVSTNACDTSGAALSGQFQWSFTTVPTVRFDPSDVGTAPSTTFATPRILVSDPQQPASYSFKITVPQGLILNDALDGNGSLACVTKGADAGDFHSEWDDINREITITASVPTPSLSAEIVKTIRLGAPASAGGYRLQHNDAPILDVNVHQPIPGDFNGDGLVTITDAVRFTQAWTRWQADPQPTWDGDVDEPYDLAPHTMTTWPDWTPIGDHVIDNLDVSAFTECWNGAHSGPSTASVASYKPTSRCQYSIASAAADMMSITVSKTSSGLFEAVAKIPETARFDPAMSRTGSLTNVIKGAGAGSVFFSEYDPATRTVRLTGTVVGPAPYAVATIKLSK